MISEKELREMRPQVRYKDGQGITLKTVQEAIQHEAQQNGIPVAFYSDQIKYGGLIGGSTEDCIVLYHPEHQKDYFKIAIRVKHQGNYAFVSVNDFGASKLHGHELNKQAIGATWNDKSKGDFAMASSLLKAGFSALTKKGGKQALEEENNWYTIIIDIFDEIVS